MVGRSFSLDDGKATGFIQRQGVTGRYIPVDGNLVFEHWRRCTPEETADTIGEQNETT